MSANRNRTRDDSDENRQEGLIGEFQSSGTSNPDEFVPLHSSFLAMATARPSHLAVRQPGLSLTYAELESLSADVAARLQHVGVRKDSIVGIAVPRTAEYAAAAIGVLRLGAAYLPIDVRWPENRIRAVLGDANAQALIVSDGSPQLDATFFTASVVNLAESAPPHSGQLSLEQPEVGPHDLAVIIYTSGSTGEPKGTMIEQMSICNLLDPGQPIAIMADDFVAQHSNPAFDAAIFEMWGALLAGATMVFPPPVSVPSLSEYSELFTESTATFVSSGLFSELMRNPSCRGPLRRQRLLIVGGDTIDPKSAALLNNPAQIRLNGYGPTETTVFAIVGPLDARTSGNSIPIGKPLIGVSCYAIDESGNQVGPGEVGELIIAGAGVCRGYLGSPALTAEHFFSESSQPDKRAYRTGDLVRLLHDGSFDYLGRSDQQIKINGFRVELGEVEFVLASEPGITGVRVLASHSDSGVKRIVALILTEEEDHDSVERRLRSFVSSRLPDFMRPGDYIIADKFPLGLTGKVDVRGLIDGSRETSSQSNMDSSQRQMAEIWEELLGSRVETKSNFFSLGGDSLLVIRLTYFVQQAFGVEVKPRELFDHPTLESFTNTVLGLAKSNVHKRGGDPLRYGSRPKRVPLSFAQQRLWFLNRMETGTALYNVSLAVRLVGHLDSPSLRQALTDVVGRHEVLRTTYPEHDGSPWQRIVNEQSRWPSVKEIRVTEEQYGDLLKTEVTRPFDLRKDMPLRAVLFRLTEDEHVFLLVAHHIAVDGASYGPLLSDLENAYVSRSQNEAPTSEPLIAQYADYAIWQRRAFEESASEEGELARQREFWTNALEGLPENLQLPFCAQRTSKAGHSASRVPVNIDENLHSEISKLAERLSVTTFMILQAGLALLLNRHGAGTDIPIGSPVSGRLDPATDPMVGFFVNTLVLRVDLRGDPTFVELTERVREFDLGAFANQDLPFERVVEALKPHRSMDWHPLFQTMFAFQSDFYPNLRLPGVECSLEPVPQGAMQYDLSLHLRERTKMGDLDGALIYDEDLFDAETPKRMVDRFLVLLAAVVRAPQLRCSEFSVLTEDDALAVNGRGRERELHEPGELLPYRFAAQAALTPNAIAARSGSQSVSYGELARRVHRTASKLRELGIGRGALVGVLTMRGIESLESMLGVLESGAAYLPLEPTNPTERLDSMISDSKAVAVIVGPGCEAKLSRQRGLRILQAGCPDLWREQIVGLSEQLSSSPILGDDLAYVIYTSGSTGRPKGVMITHAGLANYLAWCVDEFGSALRHGSLVHSSLAFDFTVPTLYGPLLVGGSVNLLSADGGLASLAATLCDEDFETGFLRLTPSLVDALGEYFDQRAVTIRAETIVVGGEMLKTRTVAVMRKFAPKANLYNHYGPSEGTVGRCAFAIGESWGQENSNLTVPLGTPIPNTSLYVLDRAMRPVPPEVPGELFLGGEGVSPGYLNLADLTAERFIPDTFSMDGKSMYRTGDFCVWSTKGELHFVGRKDNQVKIRGHRVELSEIEATLSGLSEVRAAVVVMQPFPPEDRIIGYVVGERRALDCGELRRKLTEKLPNYMVPSVILQIDSLPLSQNGKLETDRLPKHFAGSGLLENGEPTELEALVRGEFCRLLRIANVGLNESFFDLGGTSLSALKLITELSRSTGVDLPVGMVFETQSVAGLARALIDRGISHVEAAIDFDTEVLLPTDFASRANSLAKRVNGRRPTTAFVTGATGFVGAFLLHQILETTNAPVRCLVRSLDSNEGFTRVRNALVAYGIWNESFADRILVCAGDLELPRLGLPPESFEDISQEIEVIYHCGAKVSAIENYEGLRSANVGGTVEVLRLATLNGNVPVHYVSTASTLLTRIPNSGTAHEDELPESSELARSGYVQTKWVAERLIAAAHSQGLPVAIYRPGRVSGDSRSGAMGESDAFWSFIGACAEVAAIPTGGHIFTEVRLVPVNSIAAAIVHIARTVAPDGSSYNLVGETPLQAEAVFSRMRIKGYILGEISPQMWADRVRRKATEASGWSSLRTMAVLDRIVAGRPSAVPLPFRRNSDQALVGSGISLNAITDNTIDRYLDYLTRKGYITGVRGSVWNKS